MTDTSQTPGLRQIADHREWQISKGYDAEHDQHHSNRELVDAAEAHLLAAAMLTDCEAEPGYHSPEHIHRTVVRDGGGAGGWPFEPELFRVTTIEQHLAEAGAFLAAEIDRRNGASA